MSDKSEKYLSPVKTKEFKKYWAKFVPIITKKEGFDESCIKNLEILCTLYVGFDELTEYIEEFGFVVHSSGRYGDQFKTNPASTERKKIVEEIRHFSRLLGMKVSHTDANVGVEDDWD